MNIFMRPLQPLVFLPPLLVSVVSLARFTPPPPHTHAICHHYAGVI